MPLQGTNRYTRGNPNNLGISTIARLARPSWAANRDAYPTNLEVSGRWGSPDRGRPLIAFSQIANTVDSFPNDGSNGYLNVHWPALLNEDKLWVWSMGTARHLEETRAGLPPTTSAAQIWRLLHFGVYDWSQENKPWESSTRAMRYASVLGDRLWSALETERIRVFFSFPLLG
jgi:hypothetical protein